MCVYVCLRIHYMKCSRFSSNNKAITVVNYPHKCSACEIRAKRSEAQHHDYLLVLYFPTFHFDQTMCHINGVDLKPIIFLNCNLDYCSNRLCSKNCSSNTIAFILIVLFRIQSLHLHIVNIHYENKQFATKRRIVSQMQRKEHSV